MNTRLIIRVLTFGILSFTGSVSASTPARFICAARVDCGSPGFPSTQDLPVDRTPTVVAKSVEAARSKCYSVHTDAYLRLVKSIDEITPKSALSVSRGCKVLSEAFPE